MNTCDTCKYWKRLNDERELMSFVNQFGECAKISEMSWSGNPPLPFSNTAVDIDSECQGGGVMFGEKFGCIHHEPK